ncbi:MAG: DNA alkylation repair protein [Chlorobi bacterium]|nr:DNA alkylation repair protein [Chlorobiota bacterium]
MQNSDINIKTILKEIRTRENGPAVDAMERMGMNYNRNFGVALSDLKAIANKYKPNHELAKVLRNKDIRETRILAEMIEDTNLISEKEVENIIQNINTIELAEQTTINLLEKLNFTEEKVIEWIKSEKEFVITTAFILISRIALLKKDKSDNYFIEILPYAEKHSENNSIFVRKAISRALRQIALRNEKLKSKILLTCDNIKDKNSQLANIIIEEVVPLIDF